MKLPPMRHKTPAYRQAGRIMNYELGEKKFFQKKIVLGQIEQLLDLLQDIAIPATRDPWILKKALGEKIYKALAIVLVEEGKTPRREMEEIDRLSEEIRWNIDPETILQVIEDFFVLNPLSSLLKRLEGLIEKMSKAGIEIELGSRTLSPSSPEETSPREISSSGDSPLESAGPS